LGALLKFVDVFAVGLESAKIYGYFTRRTTSISACISRINSQNICWS